MKKIIKYLKFVCFIIFTWMSVSLCSAQDVNNEEQIREIIDALLPIQSEKLDQSEWYEILLQHLQDPIPLNKAKKQDLQKLAILSPKQLNGFFTYRKNYGNILSFAELNRISELDSLSISLLQKFTKLETNLLYTSNLSFWERFSTLSNRYAILQTSHDALAKDNSNFLGNPTNFLLKVRNYRRNDFSFHLALEKDSGELWWNWQPNRQKIGIDFFSFHAAVQNRGIIKHWILGDYQWNMGEGLIFGGGFSFGKGTQSVLSLQRSYQQTLAYTGRTEYNFFRGTSLTLRLTPFEASIMYSYQFLDSNLDSSKSDTRAQNILKTGTHRTANELENQNTLSEQVLGLNITYPSDELTVGFNLAYTEFGFPIAGKTRPYQIYNFQGSGNLAYSIYFDYLWQNFSFFGEWGISNDALGGIQGMILSLSKFVDLSLLYRTYAPAFESFYGSSISENTNSNNESGLYTGIQITMPRWKINGYVDIFRFPWLRFNVDFANTHGYDYLLHTTFTVRKGWYLRATLKHEKKQRNQSVKNQTHLVDFTKTYLQLFMEYGISEAVKLRSRLITNELRFGNVTNRGVALSQDIIAKFKRWSYTLRIAFFDTDSFDNRIYIYEADVLYNFNYPFYYGKGMRTYHLFQYRLARNLKVMLKYGLTYSQNHEIDRNNVKLQVKYDF